MATGDDVPDEVAAAVGLLLAQGDPGDRALAAEALAGLVQQHGPGGDAVALDYEHDPIFRAFAPDAASDDELVTVTMPASAVRFLQRWGWEAGGPVAATRQEPTRPCPCCGNGMPSSSRYCPQCGASSQPR